MNAHPSQLFASKSADKGKDPEAILATKLFDGNTKQFGSIAQADDNLTPLA